MILDEQVVIPDSTEVAKEILSRPVEPRPQPDGLKMRFKPYGFDTGNQGDERKEPTILYTDVSCAFT